MAHSVLPLLEGSHLAQHASPDEAHGAIYSALQVMDPGVGSAPALPYSLGPNSPSRHQQHKVEGCSRCPDAVSSDQPLEAVAEFE